MGHYGGGELLRAVLSATAIKKKPYFYCLELTGQDGTGATTTTTNGLLQLKSDSYFLMTSIYGLSSNQSIDQPEFLDLYDASNMSAFVDAATVFQGAGGLAFRANHAVYTGLLNDSLASCMTLPEYVLWAPNSLVGIRWLGRNALDALQHYRYLVLGGIEYKMAGS